MAWWIWCAKRRRLGDGGGGSRVGCGGGSGGERGGERAGREKPGSSGSVKAGARCGLCGLGEVEREGASPLKCSRTHNFRWGSACAGRAGLARSGLVSKEVFEASECFAADVVLHAFGVGGRGFGTDADRDERVVDGGAAFFHGAGEAFAGWREFDRAVGLCFEKPFVLQPVDDAYDGDVADAEACGEVDDAASAGASDEVVDGLDVVLGGFASVGGSHRFMVRGVNRGKLLGLLAGGGWGFSLFRHEAECSEMDVACATSYVGVDCRGVGLVVTQIHRFSGLAHSNRAAGRGRPEVVILGRAGDEAIASARFG